MDGRTFNLDGYNLNDLHVRTQRRKKLLLETFGPDSPYEEPPEIDEFKEMWECTWKKLTKFDPEVRDFVARHRQLEHPERLNVRACFRGGVSDVFSLYMNAAKIREELIRAFPERVEEWGDALDTIRCVLVDITRYVNVLYRQM